MVRTIYVFDAVTVCIEKGKVVITHPIEDRVVHQTTIETHEGLTLENYLKMELEPKSRFPIGNTELEKLLDVAHLYPNGRIKGPVGMGGPEIGWTVDVGEIVSRWRQLSERYGLSSLPPEEGIRKILELIVIEEVVHFVEGLEHQGDPDHLRRAGLRLLWDYL